MHEILIGTHNRHKTEEISRLLSGLGITVKNLNDFPHISPVEEDGKTLLENSRKKANTYGASTGLPCLADDTGLEVESLGGAPGVFSARYAGEQCSYLDNCEKLLAELGQAGNRKAIFKTVISFYDPETKEIINTEGHIDGEITKELRGDKGFGYDPVFFATEMGKTLAELTLEEKNSVSHRARAIQKMIQLLEKKVKGLKK